MSDVKKWYIGVFGGDAQARPCSPAEFEIIHAGEGRYFVLAEDFDNATRLFLDAAERCIASERREKELQQRLTAADEREDALGSLVPEAELALKALNVAVSVYDVELADSARRGLRLIIAALKPAEQPAPVSVVLPVDPERERLMEIVQQYPNVDPLKYDAAVRALRK